MFTVGAAIAALTLSLSASTIWENSIAPWMRTISSTNIVSANFII